MADSELDSVADFLTRVHTTHTVATIETIRNINVMTDTQSILVFTGESLGSSGIIIKRQYPLKYRDITEEGLNGAIYALIEGIRKLNSREAIASYTKPVTLVGMQFVSSGLDYFNPKGQKWYANIKIIVKWLTA